MKIGLKVIFAKLCFIPWFLIFFMKGIFFDNLKFVFLKIMIWATPKVVKIGAKKTIYFKPKNFINNKSNTIDSGRPRNIEITFISTKYLYSISIIKFSNPLLYRRKRAKK